MNRQMTSKERVRTVLAGGIPDRVPVNYSANTAIDLRLKQHFHLSPHNHNGLRDALNVDFRGIMPVYTGPKLHPDKGDIKVNDWGIHTRWIEHETGGYMDYCGFPLKEASIETIEQWPMPNPDYFDYTAVPGLCRKCKKYALYTGNAGIGDIINSTGMLRGMEQVLIDLITDDPAGLRLMDRRMEIWLQILERTLEAAPGSIDFLWMGEDLGTQNAPMISMDLFRRHIRPRHQKFIDLAKSFGIPVMIHTCGSSSWAYEDFIEMGITAVDTLQPEARDMSPEYLKKTFGGRLAFHGCISTAGPVAYGTPDDITRNVQETLQTMMPGGGYMFAPTHALQDNSPVENVVAMYRAAAEYGSYL